jgi:hypothetical protein
MPKSRFFRVAVEGATTDGRAIDRQWLLDAAQTYNRETYAARVNLEHIRGVTADPPFQSLGDVLSLRTQDVQIDVGGKTETRLALFAEIEALEPLVAMNKAGRSCSPRSRSTRTLQGRARPISSGWPSPTARPRSARKCSPSPPRRATSPRCAAASSRPKRCSPWPRSSSSNWPTTPPIRPTA